MSSTSQAAVSPAPLLYRLADIARLYSITHEQAKGLLYRGAFGDDWESFPTTGRIRLVPRDRVYRFAQVPEATLPFGVEASAEVSG